MDYYESLEISRKASQQQIKQAYKRLALIHHPDKNNGAEHAQVKFREISQAYTVLNDPKKRDNYDKYGVADLEGMDMEDFMQNFADFDDFLNEVLSFNNFDSMFSGMSKKTKKAKTKGRAKGRTGSKGPSNSQMNDLVNMMMMGGMGGMGGMAGMMGGMMGGEDQMQMALLEAMLGQGLLDNMDLKDIEKQMKKMELNEDDEDDDEELTEEQIQILQWGNQNITKTKVGNKKKKKTSIVCNLCSQKIQEDEILMHFSQKHMKQFKEYIKNKKQKSLKKQQK